MIFPNSYPDTNKNPDRCLRNRTGSCGGCNIALVGIGLIRWSGLSLVEAEEKIRKEYCPEGEYPDLTVKINNEACYTMGARKEENLEGLVKIQRLGWMTRR